MLRASRCALHPALLQLLTAPSMISAEAIRSLSIAAFHDSG